MKREKTAVEWLVEVFDLEMFDTFHLDKITQAKQMEKEQMKEIMWDLTDVDMTKANKGLIIDNMFKQYYESKYGKDE